MNSSNLGNLDLSKLPKDVSPDEKGGVAEELKRLYDFDEIINGLYVGSADSRYCDFFDLVINCTPNIKTLSGFQNRNNLRLSIPDSFDCIEKCTSYLTTSCRSIPHLIDEYLKLGKKVLIHCSAGRNRSPVIVAAFLILKRSFSVSEAIRYLKSRRPQCLKDEKGWCFVVLESLQSDPKRTTRSMKRKINM
jgi:protein-tyrosine phosphatase